MLPHIPSLSIPSHLASLPSPPPLMSMTHLHRFVDIAKWLCINVCWCLCRQQSIRSKVSDTPYQHNPHTFTTTCLLWWHTLSAHPPHILQHRHSLPPTFTTHTNLLNTLQHIPAYTLYHNAPFTLQPPHIQHLTRSLIGSSQQHIPAYTLYHMHSCIL